MASLVAPGTCRIAPPTTEQIRWTLGAVPTGAMWTSHVPVPKIPWTTAWRASSTGRIMPVQMTLRSPCSALTDHKVTIHPRGIALVSLRRFPHQWWIGMHWDWIPPPTLTMAHLACHGIPKNARNCIRASVPMPCGAVCPGVGWVRRALPRVLLPFGLDTTSAAGLHRPTWCHSWPQDIGFHGHMIYTYTFHVDVDRSLPRIMFNWCQQICQWTDRWGYDGCEMSADVVSSCKYDDACQCRGELPSGTFDNVEGTFKANYGSSALVNSVGCQTHENQRHMIHSMIHKIHMIILLGSTSSILWSQNFSGFSHDKWIMMNYVGSGCKPWDSLGCKSTWETNSNSGWSSSNTHDTRLQQVAALRGIVHQLLAAQKSFLPFVASLLAMHPRVLRKTLLSHYYLLLITTCRRGKTKHTGINKYPKTFNSQVWTLQYVAICCNQDGSCPFLLCSGLVLWFLVLCQR